jgi:hypothetical protein
MCGEGLTIRRSLMEKCKIFSGIANEVEVEYNELLRTHPIIKSEKMQVVHHEYNNGLSHTICVWTTLMVRYEESLKKQTTGPR